MQFLIFSSRFDLNFTDWTLQKYFYLEKQISFTEHTGLSTAKINLHPARKDMW
jgi:hypothetical protein